MFSGGIAYEFYEGANRYGLVTEDGNSLTKLNDFHRLKVGLDESSREPETLLEWSSDVYTAGCRPQFPVVSSRWAARQDLPPSPVNWSDVVSRLREKAIQSTGLDVRTQESTLPGRVTNPNLDTKEKT